MQNLLAILINLEETRFFDIKLINYDDFGQLVVRFFFNLIVSIVVARVIYFRKTPRRKYLFTYLLFSSVIFLLCHIMLSAGSKLNFEFALGLFAIFAIIRYRTTQIPVREMTYLFLITGLAVINSLAIKKISYAEMVFANMALIALTALLEYFTPVRTLVSKRITYERLDLIPPEKRAELIADIRERIGWEVEKVEIDRVDYFRKVAVLDVYIQGEEKDSSSSGGEE